MITAKREPSGLTRSLMGSSRLGPSDSCQITERSNEPSVATRKMHMAERGVSFRVVDVSESGTGVCWQLSTTRSHRPSGDRANASRMESLHGRPGSRNSVGMRCRSTCGDRQDAFCTSNSLSLSTRHNLATTSTRWLPSLSADAQFARRRTSMKSAEACSSARKSGLTT